MASGLNQTWRVSHARFVYVGRPCVRCQARLRELSRLPGIECLGEMASFENAAHFATQADYEVLLILNDAGNIRPDVIRRFRSQRPQIAVLVVTPRTGPEWLQRLVGGGAGGVVLCDDTTAEWADAVRSLSRGELFISRSMVSDVVGHVLRAGPFARSGVESLTDRELAVFELIGSGLTTHEIARRLELSVKTVESHREKIKHRLGIPDASALSRFACNWSEKHLKVGGELPLPGLPVGEGTNPEARQISI